MIACSQYSILCMYAITILSDIDECQEESPCDSNAQCTNSIGSFTCVCNEGYSGDGRTCTGQCFIALMCIFRGVDSVVLTWTWIAALLCPWTVDPSRHYRSGSLCVLCVWCTCVIRTFCCTQSIVQSPHIECVLWSTLMALQALL